MSFKVTSMCWGAVPDSKDYSPAILQSVLISIADRCNEDGGGCWSSVADHSIRTRLSERSVQRGIRDLEAIGFLSVLRRPGRTSEYIINLEKVSQSKEKLSTTPATRSGVGGDTESPHPRHRVTPPLSQSHPTPDSLTPKPSITFKEPSTTKTEPVVVANDNYFCFGIQKPDDMETERWLSLSVAAEGKRNPAGWLTAAIRNDWVVGSARSPLSDEFIRKNARPGETWEQVRTRLSRSQSQSGSGGNMIQISDMFQFETQKKPLDHAGSSGFK
jgi:hypothetical protein